ncbi:MAG: PSD1 and planctomycete cytochrome C domain-containing protein [Pirellulales bacterium]
MIVASPLLSFLKPASRIFICLFLCGWILCFESVAFSATADVDPDFARDVRPILSQYCFKCHGPDAKARQGGLKLDDRESALAGGDSGKPAIAPKSTSTSELIARITTEDVDSVMPPPHTKQQLSDGQKEMLKRWINSGAVYADHWAFEPRTRPVPPDVPAGFTAANAVDAFVQNNYSRLGLVANGPADPATWLRRVSLDLTGLPPSFEQVEAFKADRSPDAKQRVVDRLLASPALGERWARRWLDLARYADTNGYEKDRPRSIWPYRDWVIRAINDDMPLDEFSIKQIAGDLLPAPTNDDLTATGLHRNTMTNEEGGIDPLEYRFYAMVDRVNTTGTIWMGLTVGCVQCHDHKYDPLTQHDYYGLMALMNDAEEPELTLIDPAVEAAREQVDAEIAEMRSTRAERFPPDPADLHWAPVAIRSIDSQSGVDWEIVNKSYAQSNAPKKGTAKKSGAALPDKDTVTVHCTPTLTTRLPQTPKVRVTALRLRALPQRAKETKPQPKSAPLGWSESENFVITGVSLSRSAEGNGSNQPIKIASAEATFNQPGYTAADSIDASDSSGWAVGGHGDQVCEITWKLAEPIEIDPNSLPEFHVELKQNHGGRHLLRAFELEANIATNASTDLTKSRQAHLEKQFQTWIQSLPAHVASWKPAKVSSAQANEAMLVRQSDDSFLAIGDITKRDFYDLDLADNAAGTTAIMVEVMTDPSLPKQGPGRTYYEGPIGDFFLSEVTLKADGDQAIAISEAFADYAGAGREPRLSLDRDPATGWAIDGGQGKAHRIVFKLAEPLSSARTLRLNLLFERYYASPIGRLKVFTTQSPVTDQAAKWDAATQNNVLNVIAASKNDRSALALENAELLRLFLDVAPEMAEVNAEITAKAARKPNHPTTLILKSRPAGFVRKTHRHHRGEFLSPRESVEPASPKFLADQVSLTPKNRLQLAQWLVAPENPLTARVLANRMWATLFGRGLVQTEEDFGYQGAFPSNQALLDWAASELIAGEFGPGFNVTRKNGSASSLIWSQKRWLRKIVLSETYGLSGDVSEDARKADPNNVYLARSSRRRLEGEQLRDATLAAAGLLTRKVGGPSVFPPQPATVTTEGTYGRMQWEPSVGADRYRRGLYTYSKRTAPFAMLQAFDAPSGESCLARRESTDTPLQALTTMNDEAFMEACKELGRLAIQQTWDSNQTPAGATHLVTAMCRRVWLREPSATERDALVSYYSEQRDQLEKSSDSVAALIPKEESASSADRKAAIAAAVLTARVLLNTDEFINRN